MTRPAVVVPEQVAEDAEARRAELCLLLSVAPCESCERAPGDVPVLVGGTLFAVCQDCAKVARR